MTKKLEQNPGFTRRIKDKLMFELSPYFYPQYNYSRIITRFFKGLNKPLTIIDAGCGWGETSANFAKIPNTQIVGYELDADCIERAKENFKQFDNLRFEVRNIHEILPANYPFDVFCMICVLTVITNQDELLAQIHKNLPDDGWLVVVNPNPDTEDYRIFQQLEPNINQFVIRPQEYQSYFAARGFELKHLKPTAFVRRTGRVEEKYLKIVLPFYLHCQDFFYKRLGLGTPICHVAFLQKKSAS